jgi:hypothetical protein
MSECLTQRSIGQAWLDSAKSISDPRFNDGKDRFPFFVLSMWRELAELGGSIEKWRRAKVWLFGKKESAQDEDTLAAITEAITLLETTGWNSPLSLSVPSASTLHLTAVLGTGWLTDDHIDMMCEVIRDR